MNTGSELDALSNDSLVNITEDCGLEFSKVNKINAKVTVKIKWENIYKNVYFEAEDYSQVYSMHIKLQALSTGRTCEIRKSTDDVFTLTAEGS